MFHWLLLGGFFHFHLVLKTNIFASYWCWRRLFLQETHFYSQTLKVKSVHLPKPSHYSCLLPRLTALVTPQMCAVFATKRRSNQPPGEKLRSRTTDWSVLASGSACSSSKTDKCAVKCCLCANSFFLLKGTVHTKTRRMSVLSSKIKLNQINCQYVCLAIFTYGQCYL